jgi:hypothetical protein
MVVSLQEQKFGELPPSMRTQLSLQSLTMGQTMSGYCPGFGTKSGRTMRSKVMGTLDHLRYLGVVGETAMVSNSKISNFGM